MPLLPRRPSLANLALTAALTLVLGGLAPMAQAQITGFRQAVAETAARDTDLAAFYRSRDFAGIWTGTDAAATARRNALLAAFSTASLHGLPADVYDPEALIAALTAARTAADKGRMEVELSHLFLRYAADIRGGILEPGEVIGAIKREVVDLPATEELAAFMAADPVTYLRGLPPQSAEYNRLVGARLGLEQVIATAAWGPEVQASRLEPGDGGDAVIALRNRLIAMGYLERTATATFDAAVAVAVQRFQEAHGLTADGIAGEGTIAEINRSPVDRLQSVIVAMERERWNAGPRGARHIFVNLADFTAAIIDDEHVVFRTRSVVGATSADRQSPEFSDLMEFMVINPSWSVPRSIVVNEYLPQLRGNPNAAGHLQITDGAGRRVDRSAVDFSAYSSSSFPFDMRQAPGPGNALGRVKFMFPNPWNIYLHDTPSRDLFGREVRAFSHGCIRLNDPLDFAYALLARQTDDPEGVFDMHYQTGAETRVDLEVPVPVHIDYRTAFTDATGGVQFRRDIYGRDARIWEALVAAGVTLGVAQADIQG